MSLSVVYPLGAYDYEIQDGIPTLPLAQAVVTSLQPYHDKPLEIKDRDHVRRVILSVSGGMLYDMKVE